MTLFRRMLRDVCKRPGMYVGIPDFALACAFLSGYDFALGDVRRELEETGLRGFREWLAVKLDSCVRSDWSEIILRENTGSDKFLALERLFDELEQDRDDDRKMQAILAKYETLGLRRERTCWCELPWEERASWTPGYRRP